METGTRIGHFRIVAKIGEGGMGAVYRADDVTLGREVALKFLSGERAADPQARAQLLDEARAASRFSHPGIATIYEVGEAEGTPFIAMELVGGETLREVLERGPLSSSRTLDVSRQIADALAEAHDAAVCHRDIKPGNVMIDTRGRVKLLDFGLAAVRRRDPGEDEDAFLTHTATMTPVAGTVPYLSPEQLRGAAGDARSDVFAFGVLVYECLTGVRPFRGETGIDIMHAILRDTPAPLRAADTEAPSEWQALVDGCLAKDPAERYDSMRAVANALRLVAARGDAPRSLAVLYFEHLGGDREDEYFRNGVTEDIIIDLAKIRQLHVLPRYAVEAYRDKPVPPAQIGRALNVSYVLGGTVRRAGSRLRITAQLVETQTGYAIWAERYDRQLEDVFAIQDEIAQNIARALQVVLTESEQQAMARAKTSDVLAYDYYLRGRQYFHQFRRTGFDFARQMFERAIEIDPGYARAYAGLADCCSFLYMYWTSSEKNLADAEAASHKAVELDLDLAEAHASRGLAALLRRQHGEAVKEFEEAIRLNANLFEPYYFYARERVSAGRLDEAAGLFQEAMRVNPNDYQAPHLLALCYAGLDRQAEAEQAYRHALHLVERRLDRHPDDPRALYLGAGALCRLGDRERSREWARRALAMDPDDSGVLYNVACVFSLLGDLDEAIDCLEKVFRGGSTQIEWIEHDPDLEPLRNHPRFRALLERWRANDPSRPQ